MISTLYINMNIKVDDFHYPNILKYMINHLHQESILIIVTCTTRACMD